MTFSGSVDRTPDRGDRGRSLEQLQADADRAQRFVILTSVPAATTAFAVLIEIPEFGTLDTGQPASLAGFALRPDVKQKSTRPIWPFMPEFRPRRPRLTFATS
jgi:hypothetical protein